MTRGFFWLAIAGTQFSCGASSPAEGPFECTVASNLSVLCATVTADASVVAINLGENVMRCGDPPISDGTVGQDCHTEVSHPYDSVRLIATPSSSEEFVVWRSDEDIGVCPCQDSTDPTCEVSSSVAIPEDADFVYCIGEFQPRSQICRLRAVASHDMQTRSADIGGDSEACDGDASFDTLALSFIDRSGQQPLRRVDISMLDPGANIIGTNIPCAVEVDPSFSVFFPFSGGCVVTITEHRALAETRYHLTGTLLCSEPLYSLPSQPPLVLTSVEFSAEYDR
jgi:hypothetical protein